MKWKQGWAGLLVILALGGSACVHQAPPTLTTIEGKRAYVADQISTRVNELQNVTIEAQGTNQISLDTARLIVQFCVDANYTLKSVPEGWQATLKTLWAKTKPNVIAIPNPAIKAALNTVDVMLEVLQ